MSDVPRILAQIESGDTSAAEQLLPLVYDELRRLAAAKLAHEKPGQTLQPTALVHEAYLRLVGEKEEATFQDRHHFIATAAKAMRQILVDVARAKRTKKRGGDYQKVPLEGLAVPLPDQELLELHEAMQRLAEDDPLKAQLVELRFFGGLTGDQAAQVLGISPSTADRHWVFARAWLQTEVRGR